MARSKKQAEHANHERWLISYADFITLLFAFFVVMFASSQTDKSKAQQISDAVKDALEHGGMPVVHQLLGGTVDEKGSGNAMKQGPGGVQKMISPKLKEIPESKVTVTNLMPSMEAVLWKRTLGYFTPLSDIPATRGREKIQRLGPIEAFDIDACRAAVH